MSRVRTLGVSTADMAFRRNPRPRQGSCLLHASSAAMSRVRTRDMAVLDSFQAFATTPVGFFGRPASSRSLAATSAISSGA